MNLKKVIKSKNKGDFLLFYLTELTIILVNEVEKGYQIVLISRGKRGVVIFTCYSEEKGNF